MSCPADAAVVIWEGTMVAVVHRIAIIAHAAELSFWYLWRGDQDLFFLLSIALGTRNPIACCGAAHAAVIVGERTRVAAFATAWASARRIWWAWIWCWRGIALCRSLPI